MRFALCRGTNIHLKTKKNMKRLLSSIKKGSFRWENYANGGYYCGLYIITMPLHCSYGQIGYVVTVDGKTEIHHDWELNETTVN